MPPKPTPPITLIRTNGTPGTSQLGRWHILTGPGYTTLCGWEPTTDPETVDLATGKYDPGSEYPNLRGTGTLDGYCARCGINDDNIDPIRTSVSHIIRREAEARKHKYTSRGAIYTMTDLAAMTSVPARTIRYWIQLKLVPQSYATDRPGEWQLPRYGVEHLKRIQKLQRWREAQPTLNDLAERLEAMGDRALDIPDVYAND